MHRDTRKECQALKIKLITISLNPILEINKLILKKLDQLFKIKDQIYLLSKNRKVKNILTKRTKMSTNNLIPTIQIKELVNRGDNPSSRNLNSKKILWLLLEIRWEGRSRLTKLNSPKLIQDNNEYKRQMFTINTMIIRMNVIQGTNQTKRVSTTKLNWRLKNIKTNKLIYAPKVVTENLLKRHWKSIQNYAKKFFNKRKNHLTLLSREINLRVRNWKKWVKKSSRRKSSRRLKIRCLNGSWKVLDWETN